MRSFPLLTLGNKENNSEEIKVINLSSSSFDKNYKEKNKNKRDITDNIYKLNNYYEKNMKKIDLELEEDIKGCKFIELSLPPESFKQPKVNITKIKKEINNSGKHALVNSLINEHRAKLFTKTHSPKKKNDINNDILDIPKNNSSFWKDYI